MAQSSPVVTDPAQPLDLRMGFFVWWNLEKTKITPDGLRTVLANENLNLNVPDIERTSAIKRACQNWAMGRGNSDRYKAEVASIEGGLVRVGLLKHVKTAAHEVGWKQVETLVFDLGASTWTNQFLSEPAKDFVNTANDFMKYHDHRFIRPGILTPLLVEMKAVSLRSQGGIYFIPLANMEGARRMKRVVGALGSSVLNICTVEGDADSRAAVANATQDHVLNELLEVQKQLGEWEESARKVRKDSQANVLGQLAGLLQLSDLYEQTLEVSLKDLRKQVTDCQDTAMAILAKMDD